MSIKAIFYSKFDPQEGKLHTYDMDKLLTSVTGPKIVHQVPEDSISTTSDLSASIVGPSSASAAAPLLSFSTISRFLIPRQSLCGNLLALSPPPLTAGTPPTLVLSYPVCLTSPRYPRNEFIFNFALVLGEPSTIDVPSYKSVVKKLAHLMRSLEEQSRFLSDDNAPPNSGKVYSLCEMLMEDLNNYCECMIPIDELNTLNIKLFPTLPNPASVKPWHVPLFTVRIETLVDENWDLTMLRIIPFINGINSVKRVAILADADLKLTKKSVKHLLYYGCVLLLDIFSFNAIYAPTAEFSNMIARDTEMQKECARYINTAFAPVAQEEVILDANERRTSGLTNVTSLQDDEIWPLTGNKDPVDGVTIVQLFANLQQGLTVREWYGQNVNLLANIDLRRFVTFGVIKGFLYRIHRYAILTPKTGAVSHIYEEGTRYQNLTRSMSSEHQLTERYSSSIKKKHHAAGKTKRSGQSLNAQIMEFLDGTHCFDEICTELGIGEKDLIERLKNREMGEVATICR